MYEVVVGKNEGIRFLHAILQGVVAGKQLFGSVYPPPQIHEPRHCPHVGRKQPCLVCQMILKPYLSEFFGKSHELSIFSVDVFHAVTQRVADVQMMTDAGILKAPNKVMGSV